MHLSSGLALLGLLPAFALAAPAAHDGRAVFERREVQQENWIKKTRAPAAAEVPVRITLAQRDIHAGHDLLMEISDPHSPMYGKHLTKQEVVDMFAPTVETVSEVRDWLIASGVELGRHLHNGYHIEFNATIAEMEALLATKYHIFNHHVSDTDHFACDEYSLPHRIHPHVDFISPTVGHDLPHDFSPDHYELGKRAAPKTVASIPPFFSQVNQSFIQPGIVSQGGAANLKHCDSFVTVQCIRALYGIPVASSATPGNEIGLFEDGDYYNTNDLNLYLEDFTNVPTGTYPVLNSIDGGIAPVKAGDLGGESILDLSIITPLIYPQKIRLFQTDDKYVYYYGGFFDTFLDGIDKSFCTYRGGNDPKLDPKYPDTKSGGYKGQLNCGTYAPANVISLSYGLAEFIWPLKYKQRQCYEYMKLALSGHTIVFSSGDNGVSSRAGCLPKPRAAQDFAPSFPATCPYVLSVGATQITPGNTVDDPETAVTKNEYDFYSGGGFSNFVPRPSYQDEAVTNYLKTDPPFFPHSKFNATGRGFPDVAAIGMNNVVYFDGFAGLSGGTSASAPIWASVLTLINEERLKANKSTVGFVNPTLYKNPSAMNDIVSGSNPGCETGGFTCAKGWDPVTGLGTPNYPKLLAVFMALP